MKLQRLRNETSQLKQVRTILLTRRTGVKSQRKELLKSIKSASSDLLSSCRSAFSRAEESLNRVEAQTKAKSTNLLTSQQLVELAVHLLGALDNTGQHEIGAQLLNLHLLVDPRSVAVTNGVELCLQGNSRSQTSSAPDTISCLEVSERIKQNFDRQPLLSKHQPELSKQKASSLTKPAQKQKQPQQKPALIPSQQQPQAQKPQQQQQPQRQKQPTPPPEAPQPPPQQPQQPRPPQPKQQQPPPQQKQVQQPEPQPQQPPPQQQSLPPPPPPEQPPQQKQRQQQEQQEKGLQDRQAVGRTQKPIELFVDGVKAAITREDLKTHFAHFGEVLDVYMCMSSKTKKPSGSGYITLRPTGDLDHILDTQHILRGVRINVYECY
ncbi:unnamed protein product [Schistocephalus solidus]|uniref:RRM domain-containing protein n=1 Tax=Schistocephalus solidus TaxID=70667 RepID=A0A183SNY1_SCHSO|nr:unnamed protein product [Schistocephalus solidus]